MKNCFPKIFAVFMTVLIQVSLSEEVCRMANAALSDSVNSFGLDLYRELAETPGNVFFSPVSVSFAMAMTSLGAREATLNEILTAMKVTRQDTECMHSWFKSLDGRLFSEKPEFTLALANRLFGEKSYSFLEKFLQDTKEYYGAQLEGLDFQGDPQGARKQINDWVSSMTKDKIKDLIGPQDVTTLTRLVLVNAIYFKGDWLKKFSSHKTRDQEFHVTPTEVIEVPTMHDTVNASLGYSAELKSDVLELPYKGDTLSMLVILPKLQETSMDELERHLTASALSSLTLQHGEVDVWLPKFKMEPSFKLKENLKKLGMEALFDRADLSGIDGTKELYVSDCVHKAFIVVDEEGSEAAAATGVIMLGRSRQIIPAFKANHPFIFLIRDKSSKAVLFLGKLTRP